MKRELRGAMPCLRLRRIFFFTPTAMVRVAILLAVTRHDVYFTVMSTGLFFTFAAPSALLSSRVYFLPPPFFR